VSQEALQLYMWIVAFCDLRCAAVANRFVVSLICTAIAEFLPIVLRLTGEKKLSRLGKNLNQKNVESKVVHCL